MSNRLWSTFYELTGIYSPSFGERTFCDALCNRLTALGIDWVEDTAGKKIGGNCGNLYAFVPGRLHGRPLLFSAHMDTVEPARGKRAVLHENGHISPDGSTILGADDVSGIAVILEAITRLQEKNIPHRPLELLFPVAEERYGAGSAVFDYRRISAKEAYVLDLGGEIGEAANAAPTILSFQTEIQGRASHAGFAPQSGIHAIEIAAKAIAKMPQGEPMPGLTFNIGQISGGEGANIVPALCKITGELRGLNHADVLAYWDKVKAVFAAEATAAGAGICAAERIEVTAYQTPLDSSAAKRFIRACERTGLRCNIHATLGGSDLNNFAMHEIRGLVIACGMHEVHSTREYSNINELGTCVELVMELMADLETAE